MKRFCTVLPVLLAGFLLGSCGRPEGSGCLTGAFIADRPTAAAIDEFQRDYGKKPFLVMTFLDWGKFPDDAVIRDVYGRGCTLVVTWEPWHAEQKAGIDYTGLLRGREDEYIRAFAEKLKAIGQPVFLRFAHEMNGDWYPWSAAKLGAARYQGVFRRVRRVFDQAGVSNVWWIFSVNAENVPAGNDPAFCYPGDRFVDYVGLDGYNWGTTQTWSQWRSFVEIFSKSYSETVRNHKKPVIVTEFASASKGGDKAAWIADAFKSVKRMPKIKGLVLFNIDKEADWKCPPGTASGREVSAGFSGSYFRDHASEGSFDDQR